MELLYKISDENPFQDWLNNSLAQICSILMALNFALEFLQRHIAWSNSDTGCKMLTAKYNIRLYFLFLFSVTWWL
ncbi:hypothetical protein XENTR_v10008864 [Xenopus tropicalis]|nr:hypothetical protein XENTR_v10008864 [Xenopus tropicalis]